MWIYILKRFGQMVLVFYLFLIIVYLLLLAQPGDLSHQFVGNPNLPPEAREALITRLGLDLPWYQQLGRYLWNYTTGNMGVAWSKYPTPVVEVLWRALPRTLYLFLFATVLAYVIGFASGKLVAWRRKGVVEKLVLTSSILLWTVFYPWFALIMITIFAVQLKWFPIGKFITVEKWINAPRTADSVFITIILSICIALAVYAIARFVINRATPDWYTRRAASRVAGAVVAVTFLVWWWRSPVLPWALDILWHSAVPVTTLTLVTFASVTLLTRTAMIETISEDYILTARAKGVPDKQIRDRHAAPNAMLPVVTSLVLSLAAVIGGGVITEQMFSWPGLGLELLTAITAEDIPLALGALSMLAILSLVAHLVVDLLYAVLDPRVRVQG